MINTGRIIKIQVNILYGFIITTQHKYGNLRKYVASGHALYKNNAPATEKRGQFFERRFLCFQKDSWISFQSDIWILILVFQRDLEIGFSDFGHFGSVLHGYGYGSVFRILDSLHLVLHRDTVWFFGHLDVLDWFFYWTLD
jgi:hypothetical protein